jgi:hypothetical protein
VTVATVAIAIAAAAITPVFVMWLPPLLEGCLMIAGSGRVGAVSGGTASWSPQHRHWVIASIAVPVLCVVIGGEVRQGNGASHAVDIDFIVVRRSQSSLGQLVHAIRAAAVPLQIFTSDCKFSVMTAATELQTLSGVCKSLDREARPPRPLDVFDVAHSWLNAGFPVTAACPAPCDRIGNGKQEFRFGAVVCVAHRIG